jgi:hypothetical protein
VRDGINWFVYVGNNPLVRVDPSGLEIYIYLMNIAPDPATGSLATFAVLSSSVYVFDPGHTFIVIRDTQQPDREYYGWGHKAGVNWQSAQTVAGALLRTRDENDPNRSAVRLLEWTATAAQAQGIRDYFIDRLPGGSQPTDYNLGGSQNDATASNCIEMVIRALIAARLLTAEEAAMLDPDTAGNWDRWEDRMPSLPDLSALDQATRDALELLIRDVKDLTSPTPAQLDEKAKIKKLVDEAVEAGLTP